MKKALFVLALFYITNPIYSQKPNEINAPISSLVIYNMGVEVSHQSELMLNKGRNLFTFTGLSSKLTPNTIRVNIDGDVSVLTISSKINHLTSDQESLKIKQLKDSLKHVNRIISNINSELDALNNQKQLLLKNQQLGGSEKGVSIDELHKAADFYQTRIFEINKRVSELNLEWTESTTIASRLNMELNEINFKILIFNTEISVLISANQAGKANIDLRYYIPDAGWAPYYEIKAEDIDRPLTLDYRARVFNNTDIDWVNVPIVLSTADPIKSIDYPVLKPWRLNFTNSTTSIAEENQRKSATTLNTYYMMQQSEMMQGMDGLIQGPVNFTMISVSELSINMPIKNNYSIPSDSKPHIVEVAKYDLPATYRHICVPKIEKGVYLLAQIIDWEDLNLIEGEANVYFDDTYVGKSYIYTDNVSDTLLLSLGVDNKVVVTRAKVKDVTSKQFLGGKTKETYRYEYEVKNNRKAPINIEIIDQVPVSENAEIEILVEEFSNANHFLLSGMLHWRYVIAPGSKESFNLQYSIKFPRNKDVKTSPTNYRSIQCPLF